MAWRRLVVVAFYSLAAVLPTEAGAATTTTVVDVPTRGVTVRTLYVRPDNPKATLLYLAGGSGYMGITDTGALTRMEGICGPVPRTRDLLAARGIAVVLIDQASDHLIQAFEDIRSVEQYVRARDNVPVWIVGGSASTMSAINFAVDVPLAEPLGLMVFSPDVADPGRVGLVKRPSFVIYDTADTGALPGPLFLALTSAPVKERLGIPGSGIPGACGDHLFGGREAEFVAGVAGFIDRYNDTLAVVPGAANYGGIWWNAPANSESGWGLNLAHQGDTVFASWFTYDTSGKGWWLVATINKTGANAYAGDLYAVAGARFDAFNPANVTATKAGSATLTFTDANNGSFKYVIGAVNQTKTITRQVFGTVPTCTFGTVADLTTATNYQDLWWNKPANSEPGWGINLNHQGDTIFATWFTYDTDGSPLWLVVSANKTGVGVYSGDLYRTSGARFDSFNPATVTNAKVGTATFTFADGNDATFDYTVQLAGMAAPVHQQKQITREIFTAPGTTCH